MARQASLWSIAASASMIALAVGGSLAASSAAQSSRERPAQRAERADRFAPGTQRSNKFGVSAPKPKPKGAVRIATYNALNLFDSHDDPALSGEFDDMEMATSTDRARGIAQAIRDIDADIIAMQEIESLRALTSFRDEMLADMGYKYIASFDVGNVRGIECSVMSRFPITDSKVWTDLSLDKVKREGLGWHDPPGGEQRIRFARSPLMVNIKVDNGYELTVFSLHHKAGRNFDWQREYEALGAMELITEFQKRDPSRNIVVMGDFNAAPWDKSLRVYLENGMVDAHAHRTTWRDEPETPLYKTHESDRVLDFILFNAAAYNELVPGSGFVYGTMSPPEHYDWRTDPYPPGYASDHYPVVVDILPGNRS